ncbi:MAG: thioredoxin family protein [Candidatus Obscuribacter sp.]|nr:thioredoxin family protein [Candidatus Obscuribacter sp.]
MIKIGKAGAVALAIWLFVLACFSGFVPVYGEDAQAETAKAGQKKAAPVSARLLSSVDAVVPGKIFRLAILLKQEPGWHTYYKIPGDSGMPTSVKWTLPAGFTVSDLIWPKPLKFEEGGLTTYGYKDQAFLAVDVTAPADLKVGTELTLQANVKWLSCKEVCLPGKAELNLSLPVASENHKDFPGAEKALFETLGNGFTGDIKEISAGSGAAATSSSISVLNTDFKTVKNTDASMVTILLSAFVGGLILNIMPCVLPVIAIKVMSFLEQASEKPARVKLLGLVFSLGIISSFMVLALLVALVKSAGQSVGWGFLFQYPLFVLSMAAVVLLFSLSLFGLFYVNLALGQDGLNKLSSGEGLVGTFFKGVLATVLSTPCTAPFLGTALGFAFAQSDLVVAGIFFVAGLGMASPYLLLTLNPEWLRFLPRPGAWMDKFKQSLGFVLLATVVWLDYVLASQVGPLAIMWINYWLVGLAFCAWIVAGFTDLTSDTARKTRVYGTASLVFALISYACIFSQPEVMLALSGAAQAKAEPVKGTAGELDWQPFSFALLDKELAASKTVFLDFTANWCLTCKVNESTVINTEAVRNKLKALNATTIKADWTSQDPDITKLLKKFGRSGVPLYVVFPAGKADQPIILPEVITVDLVLEKLNQVGP